MTRFLCALAIIVGGGAPVWADFELSWYTFDGGGQMSSTGGEFELSGTIGQPDANAAVMTGGNVELAGGFWRGVAVPCNGFDPCDANCDGSVNGGDIGWFIDLLNGVGTPCSPCAGDTNHDGSLNGGDIVGFIDCLSPP